MRSGAAAALRPISAEERKTGRVGKVAAKKAVRSDTGRLRAPTKRYKPNYWQAVKDEVHVFLCTNDKKYAGIKKQIVSNAKKSQTVVIGAISAAIAGSVGVPAGAVFPLVPFASSR
jgi:hypothetical protein